MGWLQVFDITRTRTHTHTFCLFVSQVVSLSFSLSSFSLFRPLFWASREVLMFTGLFHDDFLSVSAVSFFCVSEFFARVFMSGNHSYFFFYLCLQTLFTATTYAGYVGVLTGQKPNAFTITIDQRGVPSKYL